MESVKKSMLAGVFLLLILLLASYSLKLFLPFSTAIWVSRIYFWIVLLLMVFYVLKVEKQKFLLYEEQKYPFWKALLMVFLMVAIIIFGNTVFGFIFKVLGFSETSQASKVIYSLLKQNYLLLIFACITAGVTEELLFRGYLQTRLEKLFGNAWMGILISALLFGLMHAGWESLLHIIVPLWIGLVYAFFYYKYRNIKILILLHIFWDLISTNIHLLL